MSHGVAIIISSILLGATAIFFGAPASAIKRNVLRMMLYAFGLALAVWCALPNRTVYNRQHYFNEGLGLREADRVAIGAQFSHPIGNPISQRE